MAAPMRLQSALEAQVAAGAPGALARVEAPGLGIGWGGSAGRLARGRSRALRPDDAVRVASVTKSVTAVVAVTLARQRRLALDEPLGDQLAPDLLHRWSAFAALPRTTPRQLLAHTAGLPNYFNDEAFHARLRQDPRRRWDPVDLVDHAAAHGTASFPPGRGFAYSDTGYVITGILLEHTGFIGAFAFYAAEYDAVLVGTHNASHVDRWPLVAALCEQLRDNPDGGGRTGIGFGLDGVLPDRSDRP